MAPKIKKGQNGIHPNTYASGNDKATASEAFVVTKSLLVAADDKRFDGSEGIFDVANPVSITRPNIESKRVDLDLPERSLSKLDEQAAIRGITQ